jgi:FdhD protein
VGRVTTRRPTSHLTAAGQVARPETLVVEEPLEIRVNGTPITVTMRTPGADVELAQGFLLTEGIIGSRDDVSTARYCRDAPLPIPESLRSSPPEPIPESLRSSPPEPIPESLRSSPPEDEANTYNVLDVTLAPGVPMPELGMARNFYATSSCGMCGKASLEAVRLTSRYSPGDDPTTVAEHTLYQLPDRLRGAQKVFATTGGLHAAALFDPAGDALVVREDIGRHNAVDKVIGWALLQDRIPLSNTVLLVSGRVSFEITQKAVMAGIPILAAVSAPSSLAVDLAGQAGLTLIAFLRGESMNVYTRPDRVSR